jgi:hypothetical protein
MPTQAIHEQSIWEFFLHRHAFMGSESNGNTPTAEFMTITTLFVRLTQPPLHATCRAA